MNSLEFFSGPKQFIVHRSIAELGETTNKRYENNNLLKKIFQLSHI